MAWDAAKPAGTTKIRLSDEEIRANWAALELQLDGSGANTGDHDFGTGKSGEHLQVKFLAPLAAHPAHAANKGILHTFDVATKAELFYTDEDGNDIQLTTGGLLDDCIPSGTKMLFYADTAPTGWTIDNTLDDKLVFVTKGSAAGGEVGGGVHSTGSWSLAHTHTLPFGRWGALGGAKDQFSGNVDIGYRWTISSSSGSYNRYVSDSGTPAGWRPAAYNFIICSKD